MKMISVHWQLASTITITITIIIVIIIIVINLQGELLDLGPLADGEDHHRHQQHLHTMPESVSSHSTIICHQIFDAFNTL